MAKHLMALPTLACPAHCAYCFGPHLQSAVMPLETVQAIVDWQNQLGDAEGLEITFHGGEPLAAGLEFYRAALPILRDGLAARFAVQSNLWLLTDEFCQLFRQFDAALGTSLDGPEALNDAQRGAGYFRRTWSGLGRARQHGFQPGCICTFTAQSASRWTEVFDFFLEQGLGFSVHAALPPLGRGGDGWALSPAAHGDLLLNLLDRYLANLSRIRISTLDAMSRSVSAGHGGICTFGDCLGEYLAVDPQGWIYSCQRFAGMPQFRLGNVHARPSWEALQNAPAWRMLAQRQAQIRDECGGCAWLETCRGGCPYNALAANGGSFAPTRRDPHCPAYQKAFEAITERALAEVFAPDNLAAVVESGGGRHGLLRKGKLLHLMRGSPHPHAIAPQARKAVAAVALASSASLEEALEKLDRAGLVSRREVARQSLSALQAQLRRPSDGLVNAYLHLTYACNLACDHCYASAGPSAAAQFMPLDEALSLGRQAARAGFRKLIVTGGEPLAYPRPAALLEALAVLRREARPLQVVLRTNLAVPLTPTRLEQLLDCADQIVVSVDGDRASHEARRGAGTYAHTLENLTALAARRRPGGAKILLAATLNAAQVEGAEGESVRALAASLGLAARFKPALPLGRAAGRDLQPEFYSSLDADDEERVAQLQPAAACGLGMNIYIAPDGACFPCHALMGERYRLGDARREGLPAVLAAARFQALKQVTVDSNKQCHACALRYLCGGFCRAWRSRDDPDAAPVDCAPLQARARGVLSSALQALDVCIERWLAAGLPADGDRLG